MGEAVVAALVVAVVAGIFGLLIGSFLNVVIYRVPRGESIAFPGSHCPHCGHQLRAWELVPVLSFLMLRARCHVCQRHISWRYPLIELLTGVLFFFRAYLESGFSTALLFDLIFISLLLALAFIDVDTFLLPDVLVYPAIALGLIRVPVLGGTDWPAVLLGGLVAGGGFWLIAKFYPKGLGFGDVKLAVALGVYFGFARVLIVIFLASLIGSLLGGLGLLLKKKGLGQEIPFGPFLAAGAFIVLYWGGYLAQAYLRWLGA